MSLSSTRNVVLFDKEGGREEGRKQNTSDCMLFFNLPVYNFGLHAFAHKKFDPIVVILVLFLKCDQKGAVVPNVVVLKRGFSRMNTRQERGKKRDRE